MHHLINTILLTAIFLGAISLLHEFSKRLKFPFVVALLILGFIAQGVVYIFSLDVVATLSPDFIFYVLLPLLLFGAALHINFHHFKLQFKTISFLATVGLVISITTVGLLMYQFLGIPFAVALLFGAMISATDPIAVLALFKSVGAPKRLALVIDGESMFNDATAVIIFRVILSFIMGTFALTTSSVSHTLLTFIYVFFGSLMMGGFFGLLGAVVIEKVEDNIFVETTLTVALALLSFIIPEHFFHLSGVIACVMAGITVGNLGETKISGGVANFLEEFWDYVSVLSVGLVFFFASFSLDLSIFSNWLSEIAIVIGIVLIARSISVYLSMFVTNNFFLFNDEPDISLRWQHVLNWGGLRGVIPLVLVFSLPENFAYREQLLLLTLGVLMFSLFVNGLTIEWLLRKLGLHLPRKEEQIIDEEMDIFKIQQAKERLADFPDVSEEKKVTKKIRQHLERVEEFHRSHILAIADPKEIKHSVLMQSLRIERAVTKELFLEGIINESVFFDLEAQFDLQEDALEYPDVFNRRGVSKDGLIDTKQSFRRQSRAVKNWLGKYPLLQKLFNISQSQLVMERYMMLKARMVANDEVIKYTTNVKKILLDGTSNTKELQKVLEEVEKRYQTFRKDNLDELQQISKEHQSVVEAYQQGLIADFSI